VNQRDELGWGPNATFRFPLHGGTGAIWEALARALPQERIRCNKKVVGLDAAAKVLSFADGTTMEFDQLISTMPLDILCRVTRGLSIPEAQLREAADKFRHSSSHIIGFGIEGPVPVELKTKCWLYFSEDNCPFYRATVFSNYSPNHVPKPGQQWSLMCEVSESPCKPVDMKTIIEQAERGAIATRLIPADAKIVSRFHTRLEYGYPTPFMGRDALANPIHAALRARGILSRGRFGAWKYEISNQDHSLMLGVEAADNLLLGSEETTFWYPDLVNAKKDGVGREPWLAKKLLAEKIAAAAAAPAKSS
jgi:protoporphyrinogen oxidase